LLALSAKTISGGLTAGEIEALVAASIHRAFRGNDDFFNG